MGEDQRSVREKMKKGFRKREENKENGMEIKN
jgi:hypothetical protein